MVAADLNIYVVWVRRESWDTTMELCRCHSSDALSSVVRALTGPGVSSIIEIRIEVRREVC